VGVAQAGAPEVAQGKDGIDHTHLGVEHLTSVVAATRQSELEEARRQVGVRPSTIPSGLRTPHSLFQGLQLLEVGPAQHPFRMSHSTPGSRLTHEIYADEKVVKTRSTGTKAVNAIPFVCAAAPGLVSPLDLPLPRMLKPEARSPKPEA